MVSASLCRAILSDSPQFWKLVALLLLFFLDHVAITIRRHLVEERLGGLWVVLENVQRCHRWYILRLKLLLAAVWVQRDGAPASGVRKHALLVLPSDRMASTLQGLQMGLGVPDAQLVQLVLLLHLSNAGGAPLVTNIGLLVGHPLLTSPLRMSLPPASQGDS